MSEAIDSIVKTLTDKVDKAGGLKNKVKFILQEGGVIFMDENGVRLEDQEAEVTLRTKEATLTGIFDGSINPIMAFMSGKIQVEGDTRIAASLKDVLM